MIKRSTKAARRAGFTLMELLAVVAIIVIIAGAAVVAVPGIIDGVRRDRAKADCKTLAKAIMTYNLQNADTLGPLTDGNWNPLLQAGNNQKAILLPTAIMDPWGQQYQFQQNQTATGEPRVWTNGPPGGQPIDNFTK